MLCIRHLNAVQLLNAKRDQSSGIDYHLGGVGTSVRQGMKEADIDSRSIIMMASSRFLFISTVPRWGRPYNLLTAICSQL